MIISELADDNEVMVAYQGDIDYKLLRHNLNQLLAGFTASQSITATQSTNTSQSIWAASQSITESQSNTASKSITLSQLITSY